MIDRLLTAGLVGVGLVNLAFAIWVLVDHRAAAEQMGYGLENSMGASEFIVVYVGLVGAIGLQLLLAPFRRDGRAWMRVGALLFAGLVFGRLVGFFSVDVDPDRALFGLDGFSVVGFFFEGATAWMCWFASRRDAGAAPASG